MELDIPDIAYATGNFLYARSFVDAAKESDQWSERSARDMFRGDTASPVELLDGSILATGKDAVAAVEECFGDIVRNRAMTLAIQSEYRLPSLCMGGTPIRSFQWIRSRPVTFYHMWSPNFALLPKTLNFQIRDEVDPAHDRCEVVLKALTRHRFQQPQSFTDFLRRRLSPTDERSSRLLDRVGVSRISKGKADLFIAFNSANISERSFFSILCSVIDFGFLHAPVKEVIVR